MAIETVRKLLNCAQTAGVARITGTVEEEVGSYINKKKRRELYQMEQEGSVEVQVISGEGFSPEYLKIECVDSNGREVRIAGE